MKTVSVLQYCVPLCNDTSSSYKLHGRLYRALILLGLALFSKHFCVFNLHGAIEILNFFACILLFAF